MDLTLYREDIDLLIITTNARILELRAKGKSRIMSEYEYEELHDLDGLKDKLYRRLSQSLHKSRNGGA